MSRLMHTVMILIVTVGLSFGRVHLSEGADTNRYDGFVLTANARDIIYYAEDAIIDLVLESKAGELVPYLVAARVNIEVAKDGEPYREWGKSGGLRCQVRDEGETDIDGNHYTIMGVDSSASNIFSRGQISLGSVMFDSLPPPPGRYSVTVIYEGSVRTNVSFEVRLDYERSVSMLLYKLESATADMRTWAGRELSELLGPTQWPPDWQYGRTESTNRTDERVVDLRKWWDDNKSLVLRVETKVRNSGSLSGGEPGAKQSPARFVCVDLSGGTNAVHYGVRHYTSETDLPGGVTNDIYKTTTLLLRYVEPGVIPRLAHMSQRAIITRGYYIGVFELTQRQWTLVMGDWPFAAVGNPMCPAEMVSYSDIRGPRYGAGWPVTTLVDKESFLGKLRSRSGLHSLDIPTEVQWEYACRAGSTDAYTEATVGMTNASSIGWFRANSGGRPHDVGQLAPNSFGLFDMHGNVLEKCRDWRGRCPKYPTCEFDSRGEANELMRVNRGDSFDRSVAEGNCIHRPGIGPAARCPNVGFRVSMEDVPDTVRTR